MLRAIARGQPEIIVTRHGKIFVALERFAPWIVRAASRRIANGPGAYRGEPKSD